MYSVIFFFSRHGHLGWQVYDDERQQQAPTDSEALYRYTFILQQQSVSAELTYTLGLWTEKENDLGRFSGFSPKCRSVSVVFIFKTEKTETETETEHFSVGFSVKPAKKTTFQIIQCAYVGIMWRPGL